MVGPSFQGIWGRQVQVSTGGKKRTLVSDEAYLRRSIMEPGADIVEGYPAVMPPFAAVLTEEEVRLIIDFFRTGGKVAAQGAGTQLSGAQLAKEKGCLACHSLDGTRGVGPSFKGIFGTRVRVTRGGKPMEVLVDEAYLRESIQKPTAAIVEGFQPIMPVQDDLSGAELTALVQYLKGVR
jgi:cytochrome c oxidase subunit 2